MGGEFGRSPESRAAKGETITIWASPCGWRAAGSKAGSLGATDEIGLRAVEKPVHFRDIHTTILHQLGLDQNLLTYLHLGREERLTEVQGSVITDLV